MHWARRGTVVALFLLIIVGSSLSAGAVGPSSIVYTWNYQFNSGPVTLQGSFNGATDIQAANYGGLLIDSSGHVFSWLNAANPVANKVNGPKHAVSIGEGFDFGAAVASSGKLWTWGNDSSGQLCNGKTTHVTQPVAVVRGVSGVSEASGGAEHLLLLESTGVVMACGNNAYGELGDGRTTNSDVPVQVQRLSNIVEVSAGSQDSVARDSSGNVWDWGYNGSGQLGDGTTTNSDVPVEVSLPAPALQVFAGGDSTSDGSVLALLSTGDVYAWGDDNFGQLGDGRTGSISNTPVYAQGLPTDIVAVATDAYTSYALDSNGNLYAWGKVDGRISPTPTIVQTGVSRVSAVAATTVTSSSS